MAATPPDRVGDVDAPGLEPDVDAPGLEPDVDAPGLEPDVDAPGLEPDIDVDVDDEDAFGHPVPGVLPTGDDDDLDG